jgi:hypothetical protein
MSQPTIVLVCPKCEHTCRTRRETQPGAKMRCPGCKGAFSFFVHGNGAVELRPVELRPVDDEPATGSHLPPRVAEQDETKGARTIFTSKRRNRPIGGYLPFEKSRSYIAMFAFVAVVGLGSLTAYVYVDFIKTADEQIGKSVGKGINSDIKAKAEAFQKLQKRRLEELEKRQTKVQPAVAKVENGRLAGDRTHD